MTEDQWYEMLFDANDLLRSAHSIASRQGKDVHWESFLGRLNRILDHQHKILFADEPVPEHKEPTERNIELHL